MNKIILFKKCLLEDYILSNYTPIFTAFVLCTALLLAAPSMQAADAEAADEASAPLVVSDAYFRLMPPGRSMTAAYMTLQNNSGQPQVLTALRSSSAASVELHQHAHINGMMRMRQVDQLNIADGAAVLLEPGGYHLMIFGLQAGLSLGDTIAIELQLESGKSVMVNAEARSIKQKPMH